MSRLHYFAYGSNLDADQMAERCPGSVPVCRAELRGFRLDFTWLSRRWGGGAADIVPQAEASVWGVLYALGADDLERLDGFEGGYERVEVEVELPEGSRQRAVTYTVRVKGAYSPHGDYLRKMLDWGLRWELPEEYLRGLRSLDLTEISPRPGWRRPR